MDSFYYLKYNQLIMSFIWFTRR